MPPHSTTWRSILILSSHLRLGLPSGLFSSGFPTKNLYTPLPSPYVLHAPPISFFLIFGKSVEKVQATLKYENNKWCCARRLTYICDTFLLSYCYNERLFRQNCTEIQNTNLISMIFSVKSYRLWHNVTSHRTAEQTTSNNTIRYMCFSCSVSEATNTHTEYVIFPSGSTTALRFTEPLTELSTRNIFCWEKAAGA